MITRRFCHVPPPSGAVRASSRASPRTPLRPQRTTVTLQVNTHWGATLYDFAAVRRRSGASIVWPGRFLRKDFGPFGLPGRTQKTRRKKHTSHLHTATALADVYSEYQEILYRRGGGWGCRWFARKIRCGQLTPEQHCLGIGHDMILELLHFFQD